MSENVIGHFEYPYSIATYFKINKKDFIVPMVTEEASVVAAASKGAKMALKKGGFTAESVKPLMIGQIQFTPIKNPKIAENIISIIQKKKKKILEIANRCDNVLLELGGGAHNLKIRRIQSENGEYLVLHLIVNVKDAMGANIVNTMVERVGNWLKNLKYINNHSDINLRIISNLATYRIARAYATFSKRELGGEKIVEKIIDAYNFSLVDPFRAATHNKGIMNGVTALTLATGNDSRAIEAGAHAYAAIQHKNKYAPLTKYSKDSEGNLRGEIELPLSLGTIGGITNLHPMAQLSLKILGVDRADQLSQVAACVGLAQNVAALRALVNEGIQKGHMKLHKKKRSI